MRAAPAVSCAKVRKNGAHEHTGSAEAVRHPLRNGFTAYFVLSPVERACCHRHLRKHPTGLTPASRRQDHTTSPYENSASSGARNRRRCRVHRIPSQRLVTMANAPHSGMRREAYNSDFRKCEAKYFCVRGLTRFL